MARRVAIGIQSFEKVRQGNYFYIDKTSFIKEWWDCGDEVTLITRPRRFGKTLNMSMLETFFSVNYADRKELFEGLSIWAEEAYRKIQGTYPVISLSFASVKETNYKSARGKICELLVDLYNKYSFLRDSEVLMDRDREYFDRISYSMDDVVATMALYRMSDYLYRYYGKRVILLLDEYDTPMQEAYVNGYWEELVGFTRSMFNAAFKTNPYLERGLMTGITRVRNISLCELPESIFSDLNHLKVVTTTSEEYAESFGFTENEVFDALEEYGLSGQKEKVKDWYDGFVFGRYKDIYNPWSILNFLNKKNFGSYWANTSSNSLVSKLIREGDEEIKKTFEDLLKGRHLFCFIDEQIVYNQLDSGAEAIWSLLAASGYLKIVNYETGEQIKYGDEPLYELAITNYEVELMFRSMIRSWFKPTGNSYSYFIKALLSGDKKAMNVYMNRLTMQIFSYFDTGKGGYGAEPERFYHGFVLGLLVDLNDRYVVTSNRESGFGRYDVMLEPRRKEDDAFILEFKVHDTEDGGSLEETVAEALKQIEKKQYETILVAKGIAKEKIRKYGFAFEGKRVLIG